MVLCGDDGGDIGAAGAGGEAQVGLASPGAAIAGGAVGNFIDRLRLGYVIDMFEVEFMRFAVFNVADSFLVCGAILLVVYVLFFDRQAREEKQHDSDR